MSLKHYYDDNGIQSYNISTADFQDLCVFVAPQGFSRAKIVWDLMNSASELLVHDGLPRYANPGPIDSLMNRVYLDFKSQGYIQQDFLLVAWHLSVRVAHVCG